MAQVFISYARRDYKDVAGKELPNNVVSKVKNALQKANISYWIDESLKAGEDWAQLIPPAILDCKVFVFISSINSNEAHFTKSEVAIAHEYEKHIIPLRIDDTKYNPSIVVHLAGLEHISYYLNPDQELERLITSIKKYLDDLENKAKAAKLEQERQKKINEIDGELKAQYDKKLSLENIISEHQTVLSEIETQHEEVLNIIKTLEQNKENLNAKRNSISIIGTEPPREHKHGMCNNKKFIVAVISILMFLFFSLVYNVVLINTQQYKREKANDIIREISTFAKYNPSVFKKTILSRTDSYFNSGETDTDKRKVYANAGDTLCLSTNFRLNNDGYNRYLIVKLDGHTVFDSRKSSLKKEKFYYIFKHSRIYTIKYEYYTSSYYGYDKSYKLVLSLHTSIKKRILKTCKEILE